MVKCYTPTAENCLVEMLHIEMSEMYPQRFHTEKKLRNV